MKISRVRIILLSLIIVAVVGGMIVFRNKWRSDELSPLSVVFTLAGAPLGANAPRFEDPFGIAVGADGAVYVTDGETGKLWQITSDGNARVVTDNLGTPSGLAISPDGSLVLAETGNHVIRRVYPKDGRTEVIAGTAGRAGYIDGSRTEAMFNGPVGVAVDRNGTIFVADTYNDRIRAIDKDGSTRTIAGGGEAGFADAPVGTDARFSTPCGIAVTPDGRLIVADTGNHRIRLVENGGGVRTIAGTGERGSDDGFLFAATFNEPVGIAVDPDGTIYVADSKGSTLRSCGWNLFPRVWTLVGESGEGFQDGDIKLAQLNHPVGIALAPDGSIFFADNANKVVRGIGSIKREGGAQLDSKALSSLSPTASIIRSAAPPRWPYDPPDRPREIAATFGEIRGDVTETDKIAWFHNGLDIPGVYGETVHAVRTERILNPLSVSDVGTTRERIRFSTLGYIHLRIGRDAADRVLDETKFIVQRSEDGRITLLRVRRGTLFVAGEAIGTLNNQNHVHLTTGPFGSEFNAIAALELPGIRDTVAPTIEPNGVRLFDSSWRGLRGDAKDERINVDGNTRIVVRAYDQMDGNASRRRLGLYRLGYQVIASDGTPALGYEEPRVKISFESLPRDETSAWLAYAAGSHSGATGETVFAYIVTNVVRDKEAREDFFAASSLPAGDYTLRVFAEDFFGNRTTRDIQIRVFAQ